MESPFRKVHSTSVATARKPNSNAVRTRLHQPKDRISKDVPVPPASMAAVLTDKLKPKEITSMDAKTFRRPHKNRVAFRKTVAPAAISPSKTSSTWSMELAPVSGTADAAVTTIDSKQLRNVKALANRLKARVPVCYRKSMAHVPDIIHPSTTTPIGTCAHNSFTVDVWATTIDSKPLKRARNFASSTDLRVNIAKFRNFVIVS